LGCARRIGRQQRRGTAVTPAAVGVRAEEIRGRRCRPEKVIVSLW
jgi:hypothetical protein